MNIFAGDIEGSLAYLWPDEVAHCTKVMRQKMGDTILVSNGKGETVEGAIISESKNEVKVEITKKVELPSKVNKLHIAMSLTKNIDRFEYFIEKATELGVEQITPITSFHSERRNARLDKLRKKAIAASKQSLRSYFLEVNEIMSYPAFLNSQKGNKLGIAHCRSDLERVSINKINAHDEITIVIGPEGDFSKEEIETALNEYDAMAVSLGPNRLRTETAGVFVASYFYTNGIIQ